MKLKLKYGLPFTNVLLIHKGRALSLDKFLLDTGSASTVIAAEIAVELGLGPEPLDVIRKIRGVGGTEYVYEKNIDKIQLGTKKLTRFKIQMCFVAVSHRLAAIARFNKDMPGKICRYIPRSHHTPVKLICSDSSSSPPGRLFLAPKA